MRFFIDIVRKITENSNSSLRLARCDLRFWLAFRNLNATNVIFEMSAFVDSQFQKVFLSSQSLEILNISNLARYKVITAIREPLLKGKASYSWPPCTNYFRSAAFDTSNIIYLLTNQANFMRRSTVLSLSLQLVFPATICEFKLTCSYGILLALHTRIRLIK